MCYKYRIIYLFRELMKHHYHTFGLLIGGTNRQAEANKLKQGINLLITTPGRLLDHLQHTTVFIMMIADTGSLLCIYAIN